MMSPAWGTPMPEKNVEGGLIFDVGVVGSASAKRNDGANVAGPVHG